MARATAAVALISLAAGGLLFVQPSGVRGPSHYYYYYYCYCYCYCYYYYY